ncbi:alpha/beta hydrolase family protein [Aquisphaera insulae]|uniref:alpha/beta hydrolase family protein n=1 Tax=Aquisphaera insulae TaxID=2712864 RepID=UPI0013EC2C35|nr:dienelactone hydrolase family protein [Aquisphaera insulae]
MTTVFLLSGNGFADSSPGRQTEVTAADLARRGYVAVQLSYPSMKGVGSFLGLARQLVRASRGEPIGLVGFSAGGTLALRLAGYPGLNVAAVLNFYGPPDLSDYMNHHAGDIFARKVAQNIGGNRAFIDAMSGPNPTTAYIVNAFGARDRNVVASVSEASFRRDFSSGATYTYGGNHGVTIRAQPAAYMDFLNHLPVVVAPDASLRLPRRPRPFFARPRPIS